jgi:glycosyltransferase involved in cell wall biosynthesis
MRRIEPSRSLVVGLTRHRVMEPPGSSLATVYAGLENSITGHTVRLLPAFANTLPENQKRAVLVDLMRPCDVVVCNDPLPLELRKSLGLRTRVVYVPLGELPRGGILLRRAFPFFEPGDVVAFSSRADLQIFGNMVASCAAEVVLLPLFVDHTAFRPPTNQERSNVRGSLGLTDEDTLFVYVGRITAEKNVHGVLKVIERVRLTNPRVRVLVVGLTSKRPFPEFGLGPFDMSKILGDVVRKGGMEDSAHALGWVHPDVLPQIYGAADVMINLTLHHDENFGYAQVEAMSCGLPVVATDWGGLKDTIDHGRTGFKIPTWVTDRGVRIDEPAAVRYCRELVESKSLRRAMGRAARQRVIELFSTQACREGMARVLALAARTPRRPRANRLSRFGEAFQLNFSAPTGVDGPSGLQRKPVSPRYYAHTYRLYKRLIEPYTSGVAKPRFRAQDVVFLARANASSDKRWFASREPLWPGRVRLNKVSGGVVCMLESAGEGVVTVGEIRKRLRLSAAKSRLVLSKLLRAGIVGTNSEGAATSSPEREPLTASPPAGTPLRARAIERSPVHVEDGMAFSA